MQMLEPVQFQFSVFYRFTVLVNKVSILKILIKYLSGRYDCLNFDNSKYGHLREKCYYFHKQTQKCK